VVGSCAWRTSGGRRRCGACTGRCARGPACRLSPRPRSACGRPAGRPKVGARSVGGVGAAAARPAVGANEHGGPSTRGVCIVRLEEGKGPRFFVGRAPQRAPRTCLHGRRPLGRHVLLPETKDTSVSGRAPQWLLRIPSPHRPGVHRGASIPSAAPLCAQAPPPTRARRVAYDGTHVKLAIRPPRDRRAVRAGAVVRHGLGQTRGADRHGRPTPGGRLRDGPARPRLDDDRAQVAGAATPRPPAAGVALCLRPAARAVQRPTPAPDAPPRRAARQLVGQSTGVADAGARVAPTDGGWRTAAARRRRTWPSGPRRPAGRPPPRRRRRARRRGGDPADAPSHPPVVRVGRRARVHARAAVGRHADADRADAHALDAPVAVAARRARRPAAAAATAAARAARGTGAAPHWPPGDAQSGPATHAGPAPPSRRSPARAVGARQTHPMHPSGGRHAGSSDPSSSPHRAPAPASAGRHTRASPPPPRTPQVVRGGQRGPPPPIDAPRPPTSPPHSSPTPTVADTAAALVPHRTHTAPTQQWTPRPTQSRP